MVLGGSCYFVVVVRVVVVVIVDVWVGGFYYVLLVCYCFSAPEMHADSSHSDGGLIIREIWLACARGSQELG